LYQSGSRIIRKLGASRGGALIENQNAVKPRLATKKAGAILGATAGDALKLP
jgi:hypothetical protein